MNWGYHFAHILHMKGQISTEDEAVFGYLFDYIFEEISFIFVTLIIGFILHRADITLCYLFVTTPLRHFAGGFHANTRLGCTILSYGLYIGIIFLCPIITHLFQPFWIILYLFGWISIFILAPVDTPNKRLSSETKHLLRCLFIVQLKYQKLQRAIPKVA